MATYIELADLSAHPDLRRKVRVACVIAAQAQLVADPGSAAGRKWGLEVLNDPAGWGDKVLRSVLASNTAFTPAQITGASDANIQTAVDNVVSALVNALAGT